MKITSNVENDFIDFKPGADYVFQAVGWTTAQYMPMVKTMLFLLEQDMNLTIVDIIETPEFEVYLKDLHNMTGAFCLGMAYMQAFGMLVRAMESKSDDNQMLDK